MALKFRRGTTAQKSGSLAFGEPFVNTTLGTLQIGGDTGDITLAGTSANVGISGSSLDITGNAKIDGNLTLGGTITIGDANTDNVVVNADLSSSIIPNNDNAFDLGSSSKRYKNIYGVSLEATNVTASAQIVNGDLKISSTSPRIYLIDTDSNDDFSIKNADGTFTISDDSLSTDKVKIYSTSGLIEFNGNTSITNGGLIVASGITGSIGATNGVVSGSSQINFTGISTLPTLVSGSSQVTISSTTGYTTFSSSVSSSLGAVSASITSTDVAQASRIANLELTSASVLGHIADINVKTGSFETKNATLATYTASIDSKFSTLQTLTASMTAQVSRIQESTASLNSFSASTLGHISDINTKTGSFESKFTTLQTLTASVAAQISRLQESSASLNAFTNSFNTAIQLTGSNVNIAGNLVVAGTQTTVNSTTLAIADSIIELNYGGAVVKGGLLIKDGTGGSTLSGSLLWDGTLDTWVAGVSGSEAKVITDAHTPVTSSQQVVGILSSLNAYSASQDTKNSTLASYTASVDSKFTTIGGVTSSLNSFSASTLGHITDINTKTGSFETKFSTLQTLTASMAAQVARIQESTASLNSFSASTLGHIADINSKTGSYALNTVSNLFNQDQTFSGSLIPATSGAYDLGTTTKPFRHIYVGTGSIYLMNPEGSAVHTINAQTIVTKDVINSGSVDLTKSLPVGTVSASAQVVDILASANSYTASQDTKNTTLASYTASLETKNATLASYTASLETKNATLASYTSSLEAKNTTLASYTASLETKNATLASYTSSLETKNATLASYTASLETKNATLASTTASLLATQTNLNSYTSSLNNAIQITGSSTVFLGNITVYGTQSVINSQNVEISDNILYLAPTGSTDNDLGIVGHYNDGTYRHAGVFMDASDGHAWKVFNGLQSETIGTVDTAGTGFTLADFKAGAYTGTTYTSTIATGTAPLTVSSTTAVTNLNADLWDGNHFAPLGTWTASVDTTNTAQNASLTNLNTYTSSFAAASVTLTNKTISGASNTLSNIANASLTNSSITIAGQSTSLGGTVTAETIRTAIGTVVTGSSQITGIGNSQLTNSSVTVTAGTGLSGGGAVALGSSITLTNAGVTSNVAGTGVTVSGATGAVTISIGQSVATNATPTFGNLTINGTITATGDITAYFTSDKRHKNNIQIIPNALDKVKQLNGVTWEWNDDVNEVTKSTPKTGLIAQEVQQVLPEVVKEREDGFLSLDYSKMMGLLVEAIKEQQKQIEDLKAQLGSK